MRMFCDWVDEYKRKNAWNLLFNNGGKVNYNKGEHNVKYHHLPIAMQIGMFAEFMFDVKVEGDFSVDPKYCDWRKLFTMYIKALENE